MKINFNNNFEFAPAGFCQLVWWFHDCPVRVIVALVKFEINFFYISRHVFIVVRFHVNCPFVCVSILFTFFTKISRYVTVNNRLYDCYALSTNNNKQYFINILCIQFQIH